MQHKVLAYITRHHQGHQHLLVFVHRDHPDAGVQVPAGTVEPDEVIEGALLREVEEESGLAPAQLRLLRKLGEYHQPDFDQQRHVFVLEPATALPDRWSHTVKGTGEDQGLVFDYYWVALAPDLKLAGGQNRWLPQIDLTPARLE